MKTLYATVYLVLLLILGTNARAQCFAFSGLPANTCTGSPTSLLTPNTAGGVFSGTGMVGNIFNPAVAGPGTFLITYTIGPGACNGSSSQSVTVIATPTANAGPDVAICAGQSTNLAGSGTGTSYSWSPVAGLSNPNILNPVATPAGTTVYTLTASNFGGGGGGPLVDQSSLTQNAYMAGFSQTDLAQSFRPTQTNMCGASVYLQAGIGAGTGNITIRLFNLLPNAGGIQLATGTALNVAVGGTATVSWPSVAVTPGVTYYMVYTSSNNSLGLAGNVSNPYPNGMVFANAGYGPFPGFDYTFQTFYCPGLTCTATDQVTITVNPTPSASFNLLNTTYCSGAANVTLVPTTPGGVFSGPGVLGNLFRPAFAIIGSNTITYTITVAGCTAVSSQTTTVNASPTVNAGPDLAICPLGSVPLQGASNGISYVWTPPLGLSNPNILNPNASPALTTTYYLTASSVGGGGGPVVDQTSLSQNAYMTNFGQTDLAQSFTPAQNTICGARCDLWNVGAGTGNITIRLFNLLPNAGGVMMATGTALNVPVAGIAVVSWPTVTVTPGVTYYLVFTSTNLSLGLAGNVSNPYPGGFVYSNPGYGPFPGFDFTFETYACPALACTSVDSMVLTVNPCVLDGQNLVLNGNLCEDGSICLNGNLDGNFVPAEFFLERKLQGGIFEIVNSESASTNEYSFIDHSVSNGQTYVYRLQSKDENGALLASNQVEINLSASEPNRMSLFPNPSNGEVTIQLLGNDVLNSSMEVRIFDARGALVFQTEGEGIVEIPGRQLKAGFYLVKCLNNGKIYLGSLIIQ